METLRTYGSPPYSILVIHGGPGAPGGMAPVARELSRLAGILEPLQGANTIDGQINELHDAIRHYADPPVTLIGHSWGAWLGFMLAARHPGLARKLILVGSGPFEERCAPVIMETRLQRLSTDEQLRVAALVESLDDPAAPGRRGKLKDLGAILSRADSYDPAYPDDETEDVQPGIYAAIMREALELRKSGALLEQGRRIACPVLAIHGDHDPHPAAGVSGPLSRVLRNFRFVLLDRCGHYPWRERHGRGPFYAILKNEVAGALQ